MAIDSTDKKASLINFGFPLLIVGPIVSGSFGQGEQQHLLNLYSGILASSPSVDDLTWSSKDVIRFKIKDPL